ncbi:hypothetical protein CF326_g4536, partial [Tilletia indica]
MAQIPGMCRCRSAIWARILALASGEELAVSLGESSNRDADAIEIRERTGGGGGVGANAFRVAILFDTR